MSCSPRCGWSGGNTCEERGEAPDESKNGKEEWAGDGYEVVEFKDDCPKTLRNGNRMDSFVIKNDKFEDVSYPKKGTVEGGIYTGEFLKKEYIRMTILSSFLNKIPQNRRPQTDNLFYKKKTTKPMQLLTQAQYTVHHAALTTVLQQLNQPSVIPTSEHLRFSEPLFMKNTDIRRRQRSAKHPNWTK